MQRTKPSQISFQETSIILVVFSSLGDSGEFYISLNVLFFLKKSLYVIVFPIVEVTVMINMVFDVASSFLAGLEEVINSIDSDSTRKLFQ